MERNFLKTPLAARRAPRALRLRWVFVIGLGICLLIGMLALGSFLFKKSEELTLANGFISRFRVWLEERKTHLQYSSVKTKVKQEALNKNDLSPQIHFEFYNELPKIPQGMPDVPTVISKTIVKNKDKPATVQAAVTKPAAVKLAQHENVKQNKNKTRQSTVIPAKAGAASPFGMVVTAEELEREFGSQLKQRQYIIQLGMFRDSAAAARYRKVLSRSGFTVSVVKVTAGKLPAYRIQQGPFANVNKARVAQKVLQKRGIASLIKNQG